MSITLSGLGSSLTALENTVNAGLVPIDTTLTFSAASGALPILSFTSATLTVSGLLVQDRVGLQNLGAVTVAGAVVSFNGSPVGTLAGGTGLNFTVGFGAFGPVLLSTIEQVAEALVYSNASNTPTESRFLALSLSAPGFTTGTATLEVRVTPENDAPVINSDDGSIVIEGIPTSSVVYVAEATDPDGDAITWSLGGPDAAQFEIDADGRVRFVASPDFEAPTDVRGDNSYNFDVIASDGTTSVSRDVMVEVMNQVEQAAILGIPADIALAESALNTAPQPFAPAAAFQRGEALAGMTLHVSADFEDAIALVNTGAGAGQVDLDGAALRFGGVVIGSLNRPTTASAVLTLNAAATPAAVEAFLRSLALSVPSDNPPGTIAIEMDLRDAGGQSQLPAPVVVTATIEPENDPPNLVSERLDTSFPENTIGVVASFLANDPDNTGLIYSMRGPDAARFRLEATRDGVGLTLRTPLDFEAPADADGDNVYQLTIQVSDSALTDSVDVAVTITNEAERSLLLGLDRFVAFGESRALQRIDTAVVLTEGDRPDLLTVAGLLAEDVVSILPSGDGAGQVGFDGTTVRFEGIAIGTASGGAGTRFSVQFNEAATSRAVEAVVEHLAYANTSDTPTGSRKLVLELVDSAGQTPGLPGLPAFDVTAVPGRLDESTAGAVLTDLDGDGTPELLLGALVARIDTYRILPGPSLLLLTGDDDPFADLNAPAAPLRPRPRLALGDLDFDGDLDLLTGSGATGVVAYARTAAGFEELTGAAYPFGALGAGVPAGVTDLGIRIQIAFGDWDSDGDDDILMVGGQGHAAFRNTGNGWLRVAADASPFAALAGIAAESLGFMHLDGDGRLDLVVLRDNGPSPKDFLAFRNTGDAFVSISSDQNPLAGVELSVSGQPAENPVQFAVGDVDGDGRTDLLALGGAARTYLLRNILPLTEIELRVTPVNDAPTGPRVLDLAPSPEDAPRAITAQQLLAGWSDPEGTPLAVSDLALVLGGGTVAPNGSGGWLYTPGANDDTGAVFSYLVSDGANTLAATARLDLLPANDAPTGGVTHLYDAAARQLVAVADIADGDGLGALFWRWQSFAGGAWTDLPGQTTARLSPWDLGVADARLRAVASYTDGGGAAEEVAAASAVRVGGSGNTRFTVTDAAETILEEQGGGNDTVETALQAYILPAEIEALTGTARTGQSLTGNTLANTIIGNIGNDSLDGGAGNDIMNGGAGNDVLIGGPGVDRLIGGANDDTYFVGTGDVVVEQAGGGFDTVHVVEGVTHSLRVETEALILAGATVRTGNGNAADNTIQGNAINNVLSGLDGADSIHGAGGNDLILGGNGGDALFGDAGFDVLIGEAGRDTLTGGADADQFRFKSAADSTVDAPDLIADFTHTALERDRIMLREIDANAGVEGRQRFSFIGSAEFGGVAGELRVEHAAGGVFVAAGDVNGDGVADFAIEIHTAATTPVAGWFLL